MLVILMMKTGWKWKGRSVPGDAVMKLALVPDALRWGCKHIIINSSHSHSIQFRIYDMLTRLRE